MPDYQRYNFYETEMSACIGKHSNVFVMMAGCTNRYCANETHVVTQIESIRNICYYRVTDNLLGEITIIGDSCGKYNIGDTIK